MGMLDELFGTLGRGAPQANGGIFGDLFNMNNPEAMARTALTAQLLSQRKGDSITAPFMNYAMTKARFGGAPPDGSGMPPIEAIRTRFGDPNARAVGPQEYAGTSSGAPHPDNMAEWWTGSENGSGGLLGGSSPQSGSVYKNTPLGNAGLRTHEVLGGLFGDNAIGKAIAAAGGSAVSNPMQLMALLQMTRGLRRGR